MEFLDTNVLLYAASGIPAERRKITVARALTERSDMGISIQVLHEFYHTARKPKKLGLTHEEAVEWCARWRRFAVLEMTLSLFDDALSICRRFQIGFYDAAVLAAARGLQCSTMYSEDLNDGQTYAGVRVVNPFKGL